MYVKLCGVALAALAAGGAAAVSQDPPNGNFITSGNLTWVEQEPEPAGPAPSGPDTGAERSAGYLKCIFGITEGDHGGVWDFGWQAIIQDPWGNQIGWTAGSKTSTSAGGSVTASLSDDPGYGEYHCAVEWTVNGWDLGVHDYAFQVEPPAKYSLVGQGNESGVPSGCEGHQVHYWVTRDYQVETSGGAPIRRVMPVREQFTTGGWTCSGTLPQFREGGGNTTSYGRWRDNIYFCGNPTCSGGGQCELHRYQTWTAEQRTLSPVMHITYRCDAPAFSPW